MKAKAGTTDYFHFTPKYTVKAGLLAYLSFVAFPSKVLDSGNNKTCFFKQEAYSYGDSSGIYNKYSTGFPF